MKKILLLISALVLIAMPSFAADTEICFTITAGQNVVADKVATFKSKSKEQISFEAALDYFSKANKERIAVRDAVINEATKEYIVNNIAAIKAQCGANCD